MSLTAQNLGYYLYSFIDLSDSSATKTFHFHGLNDAELELIELNGIGVIASKITNEKIRPQRKHLAAHQSAVNMIAKHFSSLPMSFGLVADTHEHIEQLVSRNRDAIKNQLERIDHRVEFNLVVQWTAENIFAYFVQRYPEFKSARDRIAAGIASRDEQIALGQLFESLINQERELYTQKVQSCIQEICGEILPQPPRGEKEVMRLAILIDPCKEKELEEGIYRAAKLFNEDFSFQYNGPWPPYSFVNLSLSLDGE